MAAIDIAQREGLQTVAEGVEAEDEWTALREIGCGIVQLHRPADAVR